MDLPKNFRALNLMLWKKSAPQIPFPYTFSSKTVLISTLRHQPSNLLTLYPITILNQSFIISHQSHYKTSHLYPSSIHFQIIYKQIEYTTKLARSTQNLSLKQPCKRWKVLDLELGKHKQPCKRVKGTGFGTRQTWVSILSPLLA